MTTLAPPPEALWRNGWYRHARALASPNFGPRPPGFAIDLIVIHCISLPPGHYGGSQVQQLFTNQLDCNAHPYYAGLHNLKVSSHFYIQRQGQLWQFVSCDDRAWHAGASSYQGRDNCNDYSIGIELEGIEGGLFEPQQYESLAAVCSALAQAYPVRHVAGHAHIAPTRKGDPGSGFDWQVLARAVGWSIRVFPEGAVK